MNYLRSIFIPVNRFKLCLSIISFGIVLSTGLNAQANYYLKTVTASVSGTSSLHSWESHITQIEWKGNFLLNGSRLKAIKNGEIKILVKGIKSKEGKIMDNKTYEAFDSDKNPYIIYAFSNADIKIDSLQNVAAVTEGRLTMAGNSKAIKLAGKGKMLANGDLQLSVSRNLKMTDFKMVPPRAVLGTIKVGDEITVKFDIVLTRNKALQLKQTSIKL